MSAGRKILFFPADRMIKKGRKVPMKMHIEYDDFGEYVEYWSDVAEEDDRDPKERII